MSTYPPPPESGPGQPPAHDQPGYDQSPGYGPPGYQPPPPGYQPPGYQPPGYPPPGYGPPQGVPYPYGPGPPPPYDPNAPYGYDPRTGLPYSHKSKLVAGLLQILLSAFAVGRFYTGHVGLAIGMIAASWLTCGLGAIWPLIDGILILVNGGTDADGRPLREQ